MTHARIGEGKEMMRPRAGCSVDSQGAGEDGHGDVHHLLPHQLLLLLSIPGAREELHHVAGLDVLRCSSRPAGDRFNREGAVRKNAAETADSSRRAMDYGWWKEDFTLN